MVIGYRLYNASIALFPLIQSVSTQLGPLSAKDTEKLSERRLQSAAARALLLRLVEDYWPGPCTVSLTTSDSGAPELNVNDQSIPCSITHKKGCIAVAYSTGNPIGIDVENTSSNKSYQRIKDSYRHGFLSSAKPTTESFFKHWTLTEAISKATGEPLLSRLEKPVAKEMRRAEFYSLNDFLLCAYQVKQPSAANKLYQLTHDNQWQ